ncbi:MAG: class I SAM-dependent methyltransferase [Candidatus Zixiibacteriota bacterium]
MEQKDPILERVSLVKPDNVLDVGCGCGSSTVKLSPFCGKIKAIDFSSELIDRCKRENQKPNITYLCMDGRNIQYPDHSFDMVVEQYSLHHVLEWEKVLEEMIRVSSKHILILEPIDDARNEEKRNSIQAQKLYLEVQKEVGYSHYRHLQLDSLIQYFKRKKIPIETRIIKSERLIDFDEYFDHFDVFAEKSKRKEYWLKRLDTLRKKLEGKKLCDEDLVFIAAVKK